MTNDSLRRVPWRGHVGWVGMAAVAALALGVRLAHVWLTADVPTVRHPVGDAAGYLAWARAIAGGEWWGREAFYQAPLYPYLLAVLFTLFGDGVGVVRVAQACFGAASAALMYAAGRRLFGPATGLVSAIMLALYAPAIHYDGIVQKASLAGLLTGALLAAAAARRALLCGVVLGLLALTRENAMVWWPVVAVWLWRNAECGMRNGQSRPAAQSAIENRKAAIPSRWRPVVWSALGTLLVLGPVAGRNRVVGGGWTLSTFQAGPNFYIGNGAGADGRYVPLVRGHESPEFERADATRLAEQASGRGLAPREVSGYWFSRAWEEIAADPARWMALLGYKCLLAINRYEVADAESLYVYAGLSPVLAIVTPIWHFGVLAPLAVLGLAAGGRNRRRSWLLPALALVMVLAVAAFFVLGRYRYPVALVLMPLAAAGAVEMGRVVGRRRLGGSRGADAECGMRMVEWRMANGVGRGAEREEDGEATGVGPQAAEKASGPRPSPNPQSSITNRQSATPWWAVLAGVVVVVLLVNWPIQDERRLDALAWMNVGVAAARAGEVETAAGYFELAVEQHPDSAEARYNLATALAMQERFAEAVPHYQIAHRLAPTAPGLDFNLGVALEQLGRIDEALVCYRRAVALDSGDNEARAAADRLSELTGGDEIK